MTSPVDPPVTTPVTVPVTTPMIPQVNPPVARSHGRLWFWLAGLGVLFGLLYVLRGILLPFVVGMAIAYFLDPLAERLQRLGLSRTLATISITLSFFVVCAALIFLLAPLIGQQVGDFAVRVPGLVQRLLDRGMPLWETVRSYLSADDIEHIRESVSGYAGTVVGWAITFFSGLVNGSLAVVNVLSLIFITPVVTFYLLRDWHEVVTRVDHWLPRPYAETIRGQLRAINKILAGFVRGQALVCLSLGTFYGVGLSAIGLQLGLVIGGAAGLLSFIPYMGNLSGVVVATGIALAQSSGWLLPGLVVGVFAVGNILESYVLAPRLVGGKIGLHPVWVIFALLAGGALFGFLGLLLALPTAAVVGVLTRFALSRYLKSSLYVEDGDSDTPDLRGPG